MATAFDSMEPITKFEAEFIEQSFAAAATQLRNRGCDRAWIAHGAMRASMETLITLPAEEQMDFLDSTEELIEALRDLLTAR